MTYISVDTICKNVLLRKRYSSHFYLDTLLASISCLRELHLDDLRVVNTVSLPINDFSEVQLPADYCDYVTVGLSVGQYVQPLWEDSSINNLPSFDANMQQQTYSQSNANQNQNTPLFYYGSWFGYYYMTATFDNYGERIGRIFGKAGTRWNSFKVIPERNVIQLNEAITNANGVSIILVYISDGRSADAATHVPTYAEATIEAYILWQLKEHRRDISDREKLIAKDEYFRERKILRARKNPLNINLLRSIMHRHQVQSIKS